MKVVLVQPYYENIWEAIGLGFIGAYLKKHYKGDLDLKFFQGNFDEDELILAHCKDADVVGFSCTSPAYPHALRIAQTMKDRGYKARTVFGGWHPTALPEVVHEEAIDQIVLGEGEIAFLDIVLGNKTPVVQGIKPHPEQLVWPDRELIRNERTIDLCETMNGLRIGSFQANRVCPVSCSFCAESVVTGHFNKSTNPIRTRDLDDVLDEIDDVTEKYNLNYFKFVDATFDISAKFVIEFCKKKIARGNNTPWEALIHASFATEEMFEWLKKSNCNQVNIGCESGSDKILKDVGKGLRQKTIKRVFKWAAKNGIERRGFFLLGMPNETREDIKLTEDLIDEIEPDVVGFTILCPYPGTDHYDPKLHKDVDWEKADEYSNDFWFTEHHTNIELKAWQAYMKTKYDLLLCERQETKDETANYN